MPLLILILCIGCSEGRSDKKLRHIASIVSDSPKEALASLDSIDYNSLNEADRYYYDFLTIKGRDKAYIKHTNDSLYLHVLDYYSNHKKDSLCPEVLYYGGRVYSDLGDYPTALQYFQRALDQLPEDTDQSDLRACVLYQTGRVFISLRLYEKAIPYIKETIRIDSVAKDSLGLIFDLQLMGSTNLHLKNCHTAEQYFKQARNIAERISPIDVDQLDVLLASVKSKTNKLDSAKILIRSVLNKDTLVDRDNALAHGTDIYYKSQIYDTAYIYASEIIKNKSNNLKFALHYVLSQNLIKFIPADSLYAYFSEYVVTAEKEFNKNKDNEALLQNAYYNYQLHDREREKTYKEKIHVKRILAGTLFIVLILIVLILFIKNRNKRNLLKLHEELENLRKLRDSLNAEQTDSDPDTTLDKMDLQEELQEIIDEIDKPKKQEIIHRLREEFFALQKKSNITKIVDPEITSSESYSVLMKYINSNRIIAENDPVWDELEKTVTYCSKNFKYNLQLLAGGNLKPEDLHLALLIKCGISPTEISGLIGRSKSGVLYRRDALCLKILGKKLPSNVLAEIIRIL